MSTGATSRGSVPSFWVTNAHWTLLGAALAVLCATAWAYVRGATGYVDNGDGYYLYAARRVAQGAVLYRGVMGTQPPVVYLLGAAAFKLGASLGSMRLLSAAMRLLATALVYLLGRRLFDNKRVAALAALLYALLPIGLTWDRSFDVNPPLTLVALLAALALLHDTRGAARGSGFLAALALFTKDLYLPLLATTLLYLVLQRRRLLAPYLHGLVAGAAVLGGALVAYAGPLGLHDAFLGQGGSPVNPTWFVAAVAYVVASEGGIALVALIGAAVCWRAHGAAHIQTLQGPSLAMVLQGQATPYKRGGRPHPSGVADNDSPAGGGRRGAYAPWLLAGSSAVLLATLKEGTAGPVFQLAEPAVALLAAHGAAWAIRRRAASPIAVTLLAVLLLSIPSIVETDRAALARDNGGEVTRVAALVRARTHPGDLIVAPPYYALLTETRLPGDAADTYIVAQQVRRGDRVATAWARQVATGVAVQRFPVVLIDLRLAAVAPLMSALERRYRPLYSDTLPPALHVTVWVPAHSRSIS